MDHTDVEVKLNDLELGSKEYWDKFYKKEQENFADNNADTGESWFNDSNADMTVAQKVCEMLDDGDVASDCEVLDLGCGNGRFLFFLKEHLAEEEYQHTMKFYGVDYSQDAIDLSRDIGRKTHCEDDCFFETFDFIAGSPADLFGAGKKFALVLDKGTLDAIALNNDPIPGAGGKTGTQVYASKVVEMMLPGAFLVITSCNFTEDELIHLITTGSSNSLRYHDKIAYPTFQFGGQKGSTICSVIFQKQ